MLKIFSLLSAASLVAATASAAMAAPSPIQMGSAAPDAHITLVRGGGGGGGGGGGHMGGGGFGGGHMGGGFGGGHFGGGHGMPTHGGGYHGGHYGHRGGGLFVWGYDPGWSDCYYSNRYDGWVCPDD